jgi:hypothetical protein
MKARVILLRAHVGSVDQSQTRAEAADDALNEILWKSGRQIVHDIVHRGVRRLEKFGDDRLNYGCRNAIFFSPSGRSGAA